MTSGVISSVIGVSFNRHSDEEMWHKHTNSNEAGIYEMREYIRCLDFHHIIMEVIPRSNKSYLSLKLPVSLLEADTKFRLASEENVLRIHICKVQVIGFYLIPSQDVF